jgi:alkylation response protein AidB-like acyl-CoA dehydrogenase
MRLSPTPSESAVRDKARAYLAEHAPAPGEVPDEIDGHVAFMRAWQRDAYAEGLIGLSWPTEYGGQGAGLSEQIVVGQEMARLGIPQLAGYIGIDVVGPTIIEHGTPAQKAMHLQRILTAEDLWCQGFSEPGAGSDLAALRTRAVADGDRFILNGHKVWTSYAHFSSWCAVLARTDQEAPTPRAITYLLVDMSSPGITVRPLVMSTGDEEFGEVYFDDVEVPRENVLGDVNAGWGLAMHTLGQERGPYALTRQATLSVMLDQLDGVAEKLPRDGAPARNCHEVLATLTRARVATEVLKYQAYRSVGRMVTFGGAGFETSITKVMLSQAEQSVGEAIRDVLGAYAALGEHDAVGDLERWHQRYLFARSASVYGGSAEIQRNIIAQRILGLPRSA